MLRIGTLLAPKHCSSSNNETAKTMHHKGAFIDINTANIDFLHKHSVQSLLETYNNNNNCFTALCPGLPG